MCVCVGGGGGGGGAPSFSHCNSVVTSSREHPQRSTWRSPPVVFVLCSPVEEYDISPLNVEFL